MRFATSSPLKHDSPKEWAKNQIELGCRAVVFPVQSNEPEEKIRAYLEAARESGLSIAEVGIWRNALAKDESERKKNMDYCVEQLRLADRIGARCAVNVAGAFGPRWDGHYRENFTKEAWDLTVKMVREIIDRAEVKNTYFTLACYKFKPVYLDRAIEDMKGKLSSLYGDIDKTETKTDYVYTIF